MGRGRGRGRGAEEEGGKKGGVLAFLAEERRGSSVRRTKGHRTAATFRRLISAYHDESRESARCEKRPSVPCGVRIRPSK